MARYRCIPCGYIFDEEEEGRSWSSLPHDWVCPICTAEKSQFELLEEEPRADPGG